MCEGLAGPIRSLSKPHCRASDGVLHEWPQFAVAGRRRGVAHPNPRCFGYPARPGYTRVRRSLSPRLIRLFRKPLWLAHHQSPAGVACGRLALWQSPTDHQAPRSRDEHPSNAAPWQRARAPPAAPSAAGSSPPSARRGQRAPSYAPSYAAPAGSSSPAPPPPPLAVPSSLPPRPIRPGFTRTPRRSLATRPW